MEVGVGVLGHVVVEHDVDLESGGEEQDKTARQIAHPLDVHAAAEQVGGDKDPLLEVLELLVPGDTIQKPS